MYVTLYVVEKIPIAGEISSVGKAFKQKSYLMTIHLLGSLAIYSLIWNGGKVCTYTIKFSSTNNNED